MFRHAVNWKKYWGGLVQPYLNGNILEVGAGIGGTTENLACGLDFDKWICLEPDPALSMKIPEYIQHLANFEKIDIHTTFLTDFSTSQDFDAVLYIDTLEHIDNVQLELHAASDVLVPGGFLIILVPAHNYLYSEFDKTIGHYKRYNKRMLMEDIPEGFGIEKLVYLDSLGMCLSLANKLLLNQDYPTLKQILFWDRVVVPVSRITDVMCTFLVGKSLLGIWKKF